MSRHSRSASPARPPATPGTRSCSPTARRPCGRYETPLEEDPFEVPVDRTVDLLLEAERAMAAVSGHDDHQRRLPRLPRVEGLLRHRRLTHRAGHHPRRRQPRGQCRRATTTCSDAASPSRAAIARPATSTSAGWTWSAGLPSWPTRPWRCCRRRCCRRADARSSCTPRSCTCRSTSRCGHPTELDRVFGTEAAYAGTSFLTTDKLDDGFRYGSDLVTIVADATTPGGLGTFGWDDEGVAAQRVPLVERRRLQRLSLEPRDRAAHRAQQRRRHARRRLEPPAAHPHDQHQPASRGAGMSLEDIIADTDDGLLLDEQPQLVHRRPPAELPVRRRGGARDQGRPGWASSTATPPTPASRRSFWGSCDAVADERSWQLVGVTNCGKGQPGQGMHVGHGSSGARFRDVEVGVGNA